VRTQLNNSGAHCYNEQRLNELNTYIGSTSFCPTPVRGNSKYGQKGGCASELLKELDLPEETAKSIASLGNLGISKSTWSTYSTAKTMITKCQKDTGADLSLPFDQKKVLIFIDWLVRVRNLKGSTVNSYLAGARQLHLTIGLEPPNFRTGLVKLVLKGVNNRDGIMKRSSNNTGRLPMTMNMMMVFRNLVHNSSFNAHDRKLIWAVATVAFAGAFRIGELLTKQEATFDPDFSLLAKDVTWNTDRQGKTVIHVSLKCPKETKTAAPTVVDLYQNDGLLCPVKAFFSWQKLQYRDPTAPLFRFKDGNPLTGGKMNKIVRTLLDPYTDLKIGFFGTHSFRIGLASTLGSLGFEDADIQSAGRWSSRAFEAYMKLKRTKRAAMNKKISKLTK
jgi:hypothetical protein